MARGRPRKNQTSEGLDAPSATETVEDSSQSEQTVTKLADLNPEAAETEQVIDQVEPAADIHIATPENIEARTDQEYERAVNEMGIDIRNPKQPPSKREKTPPLAKEFRDGEIEVTTRFMGEEGKFLIRLPNLWGTLPFAQRKPRELFARIFAVARTITPKATAEIISESKAAE